MRVMVMSGRGLAEYMWKDKVRKVVLGMPCLMVPEIIELLGKDEGRMVCLVTGICRVIKFTKHL